MTRDSKRELAQRLTRDRGADQPVPPLRLRRGVIVSLPSDGTATLTLGASTAVVAARVLSSAQYLTVGTVVSVLAHGGDLIVLGPVGGVIGSPFLDVLTDSSADVGFTTTGATVASGTIQRPVGWNTWRVLFTGMVSIGRNIAAAKAIEANVTLQAPTGTQIGRSAGAYFDSDATTTARSYGVPLVGTSGVISASSLAWAIIGTITTGANGEARAVHRYLVGTLVRVT